VRPAPHGLELGEDVGGDLRLRRRCRKRRADVAEIDPVEVGAAGRRRDRVGVVEEQLLDPPSLESGDLAALEVVIAQRRGLDAEQTAELCADVLGEHRPAAVEGLQLRRQVRNPEQPADFVGIGGRALAVAVGEGAVEPGIRAVRRREAVAVDDVVAPDVAVLHPDVEQPRRPGPELAQQPQLLFELAEHQHRPARARDHESAALGLAVEIEEHRLLGKREAAAVKPALQRAPHFVPPIPG
jgi:hypothetical protein